MLKKRDFHVDLQNELLNTKRTPFLSHVNTLFEIGLSSFFAEAFLFVNGVVLLDRGVSSSPDLGVSLILLF